jgi:hypothetical protein
VHRRLAAVVLASAALVAGCTASGKGPAPTTSTQFETVTQTRPAPPPTAAPPVSTGPTTAATAATCPLLDEQYAAATVGMRLDRVTVLTSDGKLVGCRIYALQHPNAQCSETCLAKEDLPPGDQPAVEITSTRYPDATSARAAFIALAKKGKNIQQATIATGNVGLCFQTDFYPKDNGTDWACTYSLGTSLILVRTVVVSPALNAIEIAKAVAAKL